MRTALVIAALFAVSCKKQPPQGDLPPPVAPPTAPSAPAPPAGNPHAGMDPSNPHAGMDMTGGNPHAGMMPEQTAAHALDKLPDGRLGMGPFSLALPAGWTEKPVTSSMRAADFQLPASPDGEAPELVVTHFGGGGAGSIDDNMNRWIGQFTQPDGKPSKDVAKIEKTKFADQDATTLSIAGHFAAPAMPGAGAAVDKTDQAMLAAIVDSPKGPYYFKLVGSKKVIDANAAAFRGMLGSLKLR